jgi:hypothetical protein
MCSCGFICYAITFQSHILSRDLVTMDGFPIGNWIDRTLIGRKYKYYDSLTELHIPNVSANIRTQSLETGSKGLLKSKQTEKTPARSLVNCRVCELVLAP